MAHDGHSLDELRHRLRKIDRHVLALISYRQRIARRLARLPGVATETLGANFSRHISMWANDHGIDPELAIGLLQRLNEAALSPEPPAGADPDAKRHDSGEIAQWRANLLALTARTAEDYDSKFHKQYFATGRQRLLESTLYDQMIAEVESREPALDLALDLGCATGSYARRMSFDFQKVIGFDISPAMIEHAGLSKRPCNRAALEYREADLELGIPAESASVSMAVMTLGTASEVGDLGRLLAEVDRVLKPGGKAMLSFYNADALSYRFESLPWPMSLAAELDPRLGCVDVHVGDEVFRIQAQAYSVDQLKRAMPSGLRLTLHHTFPTVSAILPNEFFEDEQEIRDTIDDIDHILKQGSYGYYLVTVLEKQYLTQEEDRSVLSA